MPNARVFRSSVVACGIALATLLSACAGGGGGGPLPSGAGPSATPAASGTSAPGAGATPSPSAPSPSAPSPSASPAPGASSTPSAAATSASGATAAPSAGATAAATPKSATPTPAASVAPGSTAAPGGQPTPTPAPTVLIAHVETPLASDTLAGSVGLNAHTPSLYAASDFSTIVSLEAALGVRHIRDGILNSMTAYDTAESHLLDVTGAKLDGIADCATLATAGTSSTATSASSIQAFDAAVGDRMEAYEAPNEPDNRGDATWVVDTRACLPTLRSALPSTTFLAPSLADANDDASMLGDISSEVDAGNIHRYFAGHNPGSLGWGGTFSCGVYGAIAWAICLAEVNSSTSKPVVITETGYNSESEVDETTQAKYLTRALFVNLQAGVERTYVYDVKDYDSSVDAFAGDGLIHADDSVKPAYRALQNVIATFTDTGTSVVALPLAYDLENKTLSHELFERSDGSYILALWNETPSWNTQTNAEIAVSPVTETIDFELPPLAVSAFTFSDAGTLVTAATTAGGPSAKAGATVSVPVDDHVTLVKFTL